MLIELFNTPNIVGIYRRGGKGGGEECQSTLQGRILVVVAKEEQGRYGDQKIRNISKKYFSKLRERC